MRLADRLKALESARNAATGHACACRGIRCRQEPRGAAEAIARALSQGSELFGPELPPCDHSPFLRAMNQRLGELLNA